MNQDSTAEILKMNSVQQDNVAAEQAQPLSQGNPQIHGPTPMSPGAGQAIRRRPVSVARQQATNQTSLPSPISPQSGISSPLNGFGKTSQYFPPQPSSEALGVAQVPQYQPQSNPYPPPPPLGSINPSAQLYQQPQSHTVYSPPPIVQNGLPTPPPSTASNSQPYFPPPTPQPAAVPSYNPGQVMQSPYPVYNPAQMDRSTFQMPGYPPPSSTSTAGAGSLPANVASPIRSSSKRLSTWSKEAATKYWNKETAKKAYKNSVDFLVKTNDKLDKVVQPMMPVLAVTNPDLASAIQVSQAMQNAQNAQNVQNVANGTPNQAGGGLNTMGHLAAALIQSSGDDSENSGTGANPLLAALEQSANNPYGGGADTNALMAALTQSTNGNTYANGSTDPNTLLISSLIQQQSNAATASLLANMNNNAQSDQAQLIAAIIQQQQEQSAATAAAMMAATGSPNPAYNTATAQADSRAMPGANTFYNGTNPSIPREATVPLHSPQQSGPQGLAQQPPPTSSPISSTSLPPQAQPVVIPTNTAAAAWVHYQAAMFGLGDIYLPPDHGISDAGYNCLVGDLTDLSGHFEIRLLYTASQVLKDVATTQDLTKDGDTTVLEPCAVADFGIPTGGVSLTCGISMNEAEADGAMPAMYKAIVQSPYGHGLAVSFFMPVQQLPAAKVVARFMLSSIKWIDRSTVSKSVAGQLVGKWRFEDEPLLIELEDADSNAETKELVFTADGRYFYDRKGGVDQQQQDRDGAYDPDHTRGQFEAYEYAAGGCVHLVLVEERTGSVEVQAVELSEGVMVVKEKRYLRVSSS
ncbi:hypothetical protein JX266_001388 [Neoarthrinium moseri]|nr:hypothetical protein JX266_001388 [Neoarthrinium moseri]